MDGQLDGWIDEICHFKLNICTNTIYLSIYLQIHPREWIDGRERGEEDRGRTLGCMVQVCIHLCMYGWLYVCMSIYRSSLRPFLPFFLTFVYPSIHTYIQGANPIRRRGLSLTRRTRRRSNRSTVTDLCNGRLPGMYVCVYVSRYVCIYRWLDDLLPGGRGEDRIGRPLRIFVTDVSQVCMYVSMDVAMDGWMDG